MTEHKNVGVVCEAKEGKLAPISTEALGIGRKLAGSLGEELVALVVGSKVGGMAESAVHFGADTVYVADDPLFADYQPDAYVAAIGKLVETAPPRILIFGQTDMGRDLAPRVAFRLGTVATLDCLELAIDGSTKRLLQTKPVYGGNALRVVTTRTDPQIVTIRTRAMTALSPDTSRKGEIVTIDAGVDPAVVRTRLEERVAEEVPGVKLEDAGIIVAGGRGIGGPEGFAVLEELARALQGAVGASRPACDSKWVPDTLLVGLTGKIVAPDAYIAVGISGSCQHMAGCSGSKHLIAVNQDPEANIFKFASYGVVGDWKKVIPALTEKIREMTA